MLRLAVLLALSAGCLYDSEADDRDDGITEPVWSIRVFGTQVEVGKAIYGFATVTPPEPGAADQPARDTVWSTDGDQVSLAVSGGDVTITGAIAGMAHVTATYKTGQQATRTIEVIPAAAAAAAAVAAAAAAIP